MTSRDVMGLRAAIGIQAAGFDDLSIEDYAELLVFSGDFGYESFKQACERIQAKWPNKTVFAKAVALAEKVEAGELDVPAPSTDSPTASIRMYPIESCRIVDGVRIARVPTAEEVASYFSHPKAALVDVRHWTSRTKRSRIVMTLEQVERFHSDHKDVAEPIMARNNLRRGPGRPPLAEGEGKTERAEWRTTADRKAKAQRLADAAGLSLSAWLDGLIDSQPES